MWSGSLRSAEVRPLLKILQYRCSLKNIFIHERRPRLRRANMRVSTKYALLHQSHWRRRNERLQSRMGGTQCDQCYVKVSVTETRGIALRFQIYQAVGFKKIALSSFRCPRVGTLHGVRAARENLPSIASGADSNLLSDAQHVMRERPRLRRGRPIRGIVPPAVSTAE